VPSGVADDFAQECARYEWLIAESGGIDLQLLGLGAAGHIGFNEPLSALRSRTREKALTPTTRRQNAEMFGGRVQDVPTRAITMGVGTILESKRCLLLVTGAAKARILAKAVEGPITSMITATALQLHPRCTVIADEAAARSLKGKTYYRWMFDHEPEWADFREARPANQKSSRRV
jgi:glucosamine-6-phosphate deaminase